MGQGYSNLEILQYPFCLKTHHSNCPLKNAVEENDFRIFYSELKAGLHFLGFDSEQLMNPAGYVFTINSVSLDMSSGVGRVVKVKQQQNKNDNVNLFAFTRKSSLDITVEPDISDLQNGLMNDPSDLNMAKYCMGKSLLTSKIGSFYSLNGDGYDEECKVMLHSPCKCPGRYAAMDLNAYDNSGRTALNVAIRKRDKMLVKLCLYCGANPNKWNKFGETPLHMAAAMGFYQGLELLLEYGADCNAFDEPPSQLLHQCKQTALMAAAANGHTLCTAALINAGAHVNLQDKDGETALHKSCKYGYSSCVIILLKHKAYGNLRTNDGVTALQLALLFMHNDVAKTLVDYGCDVTLYSSDLLPILSLAAMFGELSVVEKCMKEGVKVDKLDRFNNTALYYTFTLDFYFVKKLPIFSCSGSSHFDRMYIPGSSRKEILEILINNGANVERVLAECLQNTSRDILSKKHFSLTENIAIFQRMIQTCGFGAKITVININDLFWQMLQENGQMLAKLLLFAVPRLDYRIGERLKGALDWTGAHTEAAKFVYLETAGADLSTATWISTRIKEPRSLQEWARDSIRMSISSNVLVNVHELHIPKMLKNYICLRDVLAI